MTAYRDYWGDLSPGMKRIREARGETAGTYNAWMAKPQLERTAISKEAKEAGYESGIQFANVQAQVRKHTPSHKRITPKTKPQSAAQMLLKTKGSEGRRNRKIIPKLFNFDEFDRVDWDNFLQSP